MKLCEIVHVVNLKHLFTCNLKKFQWQMELLLCFVYIFGAFWVRNLLFNSRNGKLMDEIQVLISE